MLQIIISPAKTMTISTDLAVEPTSHTPSVHTTELYTYLQSLTETQLKNIWKCSDKLVSQNYERLHSYRLNEAATPALLAYDGIVFTHIAAGVFTDRQWAYADQHLFILSALYGALRPRTPVIPYRLEMQARLLEHPVKTLYRYWEDIPAKTIVNAVYESGHDKRYLINLASSEYSKTIMPYVPDDIHCISCTFGELQNGKLKVKATPSKIARGEMVRYMTETDAQTPETLKHFDRLGYAYDETRSSENEFVFIQTTPVNSL